MSSFIPIMKITMSSVMEEKSKESEYLLDELLKSSSEWLFSCDKDGKIKFVSEGVRNITGFSPKKFLESGNFFYEIIAEKDRRKYKNHKKKAFSSRRKLSLEFTIRTKRGELKEIVHKCSPVFDKKGKIIGRIGKNIPVNECFISEKKRKEAEKLMNLIYNEFPDPACVIDKNFEILSVNKTFLKIIGKRKKEVIGKKCYEISKGRETPCEDCSIIEIFNRKKPAINERRLFLKNGDIKYLKTWEFPIKDDKGEVYSVMIVTRDITREKFIEISHQKGKGQKEKKSPIVPDVLFKLERNGNILNFKISKQDFPIFKDRNLAYKNIKELFDKRISQKIISLLRKAMDENEIKVFEFSVNWHGEKREIDGRFIPDKETSLLLLRDATEEKELEEQKKAIEEEHRRLALVIEQTTEAVVITDVDGNIVYINPAFEKITGYRAEEVLGQNPRILQSGEHSKEFYKELWDTILSGKTWKGTFKNKRKDGSIFYESAIIFPIYDEKGKIKFFAGLKRDITEEILLRERLEQSQKMEAIGRLTGGITHDFNNFLTVINGYADLLLNKSAYDDPNYKIYEGIKTAGEKSKSLVKQLLAFSRKQIFATEIIDVNFLIENFKKMIKRMISEDIEISIELSKNIPMIKADPTQIEQILINLVINARDAIIAHGGKERKIKIATKSININENFAKLHGIETKGEFVVISVSDTGHGIRKKDLQKIFEPFFTTKEKGKGTGLGLSTVYGIVKQNGGFINVYSEPGKGAIFNVYWPAVKEKIEEKEIEANKKVKGGNEVILFVEDDKDILNFAKNALAEYGYKIVDINKPKNLIEILREKKINPSLLITDVVMPGISGREVAKIVKKTFPQVKIIFTSGYTDDHTFIREVIENNLNFLPKPYTIRELAELVRKVLDKK